MAQFLEAMMLTAFSVGWYCSIYRMLKVRQVTGKSLGFVLLMIFGYCCGLGSKCLIWAETGTVPTILYLYAWNTTVIACDAWLVHHYSRASRIIARLPGAACAPAGDESTPSLRRGTEILATTFPEYGRKAG